MQDIKKLIDIRIFITIITYTIIFYYLGYSVYTLNQTSIYDENGILENIQVLTLTLSCLIFLLPVINQKREDKLILLFFSLLCLGFILRELDVEKLNVPDILIFVGSGIGRNIIITTGFIILISYAVVNRHYYKKLGKKFIMSVDGSLMILAAIFLFSGSYFEHNTLLQHHVFLEEIFELSGYVLILLVSLILYKNKLYLKAYNKQTQSKSES